MITNATLTQVSVPGTPNVRGEVAFVAGPSIAVRSCIDAPTFYARRQLGATIKDATAVIYVPGTPGVTIKDDYRLRLTADGEATRVWEVVHVVARNKGSLTHTEAYVMEVTSP